MTTERWDAGTGGWNVGFGLEALPPVGLVELEERASLQTRVDRKYVLPFDEVRRLLTVAGEGSRVLQIGDARSFAYESVYFDTADLTSYLLTARRRRRRFKVRTRTYVDSELCWLEVKTHAARGLTVKNRLPYEPSHQSTLAPGRWFVDRVLAETVLLRSERLVFAPTLVTRYRRSTLYCPATDSRLTIDLDLCWADHSRHQWLPGLAIVETKTGSSASRFDRLLWARGHRPTRISKYATCLAALRPELPSTPWRRTLRRQFLAAGSPAGHPISR